MSGHLLNKNSGVAFMTTEFNLSLLQISSIRFCQNSTTEYIKQKTNKQTTV
jgi:hypothetical protein